MKTDRSNQQSEAKRMDVINRKTLLLHAGVEGKDIARSTRLSRALVSFVINGHRRNARIERAISRITKTPRSELWT